MQDIFVFNTSFTVITKQNFGPKIFILQVTLVHSSDVLVAPNVQQKARDIMKEKFEKKKINLILGN